MFCRNGSFQILLPKFSNPFKKQGSTDEMSMYQNVVGHTTRTVVDSVGLLLRPELRV